MDDFRPQPNQERLRAAYHAACRLGLMRRDDEDALKFLATAWDVAKTDGVDSPWSCLSHRVAYARCLRWSPAGAAWAKQVLDQYRYEHLRSGERVAVG